MNITTIIIGIIIATILIGIYYYLKPTKIKIIEPENIKENTDLILYYNKVKALEAQLEKTTDNDPIKQKIKDELEDAYTTYRNEMDKLEMKKEEMDNAIKSKTPISKESFINGINDPKLVGYAMKNALIAQTDDYENQFISRGIGGDYGLRPLPREFLNKIANDPGKFNDPFTNGIIDPIGPLDVLTSGGYFASDVM